MSSREMAAEVARQSVLFMARHPEDYCPQVIEALERASVELGRKDREK